MLEYFNVATFVEEVTHITNDETDSDEIPHFLKNMVRQRRLYDTFHQNQKPPLTAWQSYHLKPTYRNLSSVAAETILAADAAHDEFSTETQNLLYVDLALRQR